LGRDPLKQSFLGGLCSLEWGVEGWAGRMGGRILLRMRILLASCCARPAWGVCGLGCCLARPGAVRPVFCLACWPARSGDDGARRGSWQGQQPTRRPEGFPSCAGKQQPADANRGVRRHTGRLVGCLAAGRAPTPAERRGCEIATRFFRTQPPPPRSRRTSGAPTWTCHVAVGRHCSSQRSALHPRSGPGAGLLPYPESCRGSRPPHPLLAAQPQRLGALACRVHTRVWIVERPPAEAVVVA
jgi:hypothetical protein